MLCQSVPKLSVNKRLFRRFALVRRFACARRIGTVGGGLSVSSPRTSIRMLNSGNSRCASRIRIKPMKRILLLLIAAAFLSEAKAQDVKRNIPYAEPAQERQVLDVYSPPNAKNLPVV